MTIPSYSEISVKNLYEDAMKDPEVALYLPDLENNSNKLPEREFFFGILSTIKRDYLKKIIADAHAIRLKGNQDEK